MCSRSAKMGTFCAGGHASTGAANEEDLFLV